MHWETTHACAQPAGLGMRTWLGVGLSYYFWNKSIEYFSVTDYVCPS